MLVRLKIDAVDHLVDTSNLLAIRGVDDGRIIPDANRDLRKLPTSTANVCEEGCFHG